MTTAATAATPMTIPIDQDFADALLAGLSQPRKRIPPKFFYDAEGSRIFEAITELDAYYPTRTELGILPTAAAAIAARVGPGAVIVEPGAGALLKAGLLLEALERPAAFAPGDISVDHLREAASTLADTLPALPVHPFKLDFDHDFTLPAEVRALGPVLVFFPGSTIGNFDPEGAIGLLRRFGRIAGARHLVIGVDRKKDAARLIHAYDDENGVTAAFNLNVLARANRELGADFDLDSFRHVALYNAEAGRIEMHLEATRGQTVSLLGRQFVFAPGERIHTENSYKYAVAEFQALAAKAGWTAEDVWSDADDLFSLYLFSRTPD